MLTRSIWILSLAFGLAACAVPDPLCTAIDVRPVSADDDFCVMEWDCADGLQRVQCQDVEGGGAECACYVDGLPQLDGDAGPARRFVTGDDITAICGDEPASRIERVNEGCRWRVELE